MSDDWDPFDHASYVADPIPLATFVEQTRKLIERGAGGPPEVAPGWEGQPEHATIRVRATPFVWRDPRTIPSRQFIYDRHYCRKFVWATAAQGGLGKSSLGMVEALAMVTGRPLLGIRPSKRMKVWYWNGEDPLEEIERRFAAIMLHYDIDPGEVGGRLFVNSGRDTPIVLATTTKTGTRIEDPVSDAVEREIQALGIDCMILDPFVSTHDVPKTTTAPYRRSSIDGPGSPIAPTRQSS